MLINEAFDQDEINKIVEANKTHYMVVYINKHWNSPGTGLEKGYDVTVTPFNRETDTVDTDIFFPSYVYEMPLMADAMARTLCVELAMHDVEVEHDWGITVWDHEKDDIHIGEEYVCPHVTSIASINETFYKIEDEYQDSSRPQLRVVH